MIPNSDHASQVHRALTKDWVFEDNFYQQDDKPLVVLRIIKAWEKIRPTDQLERTNHALALELAEVKAELNQRLADRTQAFIEKEVEARRAHEATKRELQELRNFIGGIRNQLLIPSHDATACVMDIYRKSLERP